MKKLIKQIININNYLQLPVPCDKDWDYLIKFCSYHELLPLLFLKYNHQLPPEKQEKFRVNYYFSIARNMVLMEEFLKLKTKFEKTGIEFLPLKGIDFIITIYPDINFRSMTDIDILVPKQKLKKPGLRRQMIQIGSTMENQILTLRLKESPPDVLITPQLDEFQFFDFARTKEIIAAGEKAAEKMLPKIENLLNH